MTKRTILFLGNAYGSTQAAIEATVDGEIVFSGAVNTVNGLPPEIDMILTDEEEKNIEDSMTVLFSFDIPFEKTGDIKVSIAPLTENADILIGKFKANYTPKFRDELTAAQILELTNPDVTQEERLAISESIATSPLSPEEIAIVKDPATTKEQKRQIFVAHNMNLMTSSGENNYQNLVPMFAKVNDVIIDGISIPYFNQFLEIADGSEVTFDIDISFPGAPA